MGIPENVKQIPSGNSYKFYDSKKGKSSFLLGFEYEVDHINWTKPEKEELAQSNINRSDFVQKKIDFLIRKFPDYSLIFDGSHYEDSEKYGKFGSMGIEFRSPVGPLSANEFWANELIPYAEKQNTEFNGKHNNGGIHINIQKNDYTNKAAPKVFEFIHSPDSWKFIKQISKRGVTDNPSVTHNERWKYAKRRDIQDWNGGIVKNKYSLITGHKSYAYEIRLFGGHPTVLIPAIQFAHACFIMGYQTKDEKITVKSFIKWISTRKRYTELYNFIINEIDIKDLS